MGLFLWAVEPGFREFEVEFQAGIRAQMNFRLKGGLDVYKLGVKFFSA